MIKKMAGFCIVYRVYLQGRYVGSFYGLSEALEALARAQAKVQQCCGR